MGQQPAVLSLGRRTVVQPVLRTVTRQGLPHRVANIDDTGLLHTHGIERSVLKRMGHHTQGVEGLLTEDYHRAYHRYHSACHKLLPATADIIFRLPKNKDVEH